jgi:midasin (ATPase involved in ribosome maturation)
MQKVNNFLQFLNEAKAKAIPAEETKVEIPDSLARQIREAYRLSLEMEKITAEIDAKLTPLKQKFSTKEQQILEQMKALGLASVKLQKITAKIKTTGGNTTTKYKKVLEELTPKLTANLAAVLSEITAQYTTQNEPIPHLELQEGLIDKVKNVTKQFVDWAKGLLTKLAGVVKPALGTSDEFIKAAEKEGLI